jgi:hypothetical protein
VSDLNERRLFGRQRRANADVPRDRRYTVKVNAGEDAKLRARASAQDVTVPRLMFESALNVNVETNTERKAAIAELFAVSRLLGNVANNMNQVAKFANSEGTFPAEAAELTGEYRRMVGRIDDVIERLAGS